MNYATCLLTIHGIGLQHEPDDAHDIPGYADGLHQMLVDRLGASLLGDDPERGSGRKLPGDRGPVYVRSDYPARSGKTAAGLERLSRPLAPESAKASHVALIYCGLEPDVPRPGSMTETVARGAFSVGHYATVRGAVGMLFRDVTAAMKSGPPGDGQLQVRDDQAHGHHPLLALAGVVTRHPETDPTGPFAVLRNIEDDVAAYVCRNDLRQRVRDFVREALLRLAQRDDVEKIIVNAHSQGTVVAYDVVREAAPATLAKIPWLITAGSPLRKFADTLSWGSEIGGIAKIPNWCNVWDALDPVADPLTPGRDWKRGERAQPTEPPLFVGIDSIGQVTDAGVVDCKVDNVAVVPGTGLRAHDYWGDEPYFVTPLAAVIEDVVKGTSSVSATTFPDHFAAPTLVARAADARATTSKDASSVT